MDYVKHLWRYLLVLAPLTGLLSCNPTEKKQAPVKHLIVIGFDGMSPDGIRKAHTPVLDSLMAQGSATLHARSVLPSSSSPNWAAMIMGAGPEHHGITSNAWEKNNHILPPNVATANGTFPTIFDLFAHQRIDAHVGAIYDWDGFGRLFDKATVDFDIDGDHEDKTTQAAVDYIKEHRPHFTFIHLDHVDHAGHAQGHGSPEYYAAVAKADSLAGAILQATKEAGIFDETLFLLSADHGGLGTGHGGETLAEMEIPFILYGPGIKKGYTIQNTVMQYDNAATVAYAFGLEMPQAWIGRPVLEAFEGQPNAQPTYTKPERFEAPIVKPDQGHFANPGGLFLNEEAVLELYNPNQKGEIRFTLNGENPTEKSPLYTQPLPIKEPAVVRAGIFVDKQLVSTLAQADFRFVSPEGPNGLRYSTYPLESLTVLPNFDALTPSSEGKTYEFSSNILKSAGEGEAHIAIRFQGEIQIDTPGLYTFYTHSDDGSKLYINDRLIVDNDGDHGVREKGGALALETGRHRIRVDYFNGGGGYHLDVKFKGPEYVKQTLPAHLLYPKN
ncbi:nucleotide pyrophosphatase [Sediminicola luteus]|uniref:Nucleotide pyrophosphatase n=2 Tax=Sediminicola luteus TaxID=319238 RepID=A0A2A4GCI5_9FLAO|nr:nucleotide pyrophosphatase [Sediminicola luteus]